MMKPERHVWEDDSTHRAVAGKEYDEVWDYAEQLEDKSEALMEALEELQKGIYDFTELPIYAKNFVHRITSEALSKAKGE